MYDILSNCAKFGPNQKKILPFNFRADFKQDLIRNIYI